jgi:MarR family transcriptional regulator, organic hydroperoxide resistance regulator
MSYTTCRMRRTSPLEETARELDRDLRAIREMVRRPLAAEIAKGELTGPQQSTMALLVRSEGLSLKELSGRLGLAHSTTSGIVDRLERRGMVERKPDEADRRLTRIVATEEVRRFLETTMPLLAIHPLVEALRKASAAERVAISAGLKTLRKVLERRKRNGVDRLA